MLEAQNDLWPKVGKFLEIDIAMFYMIVSHIGASAFPYLRTLFCACKYFRNMKRDFHFDNFQRDPRFSGCHRWIFAWLNNVYFAMFSNKKTLDDLTNSTNSTDLTPKVDTLLAMLFRWWNDGNVDSKLMRVFQRIEVLPVHILCTGDQKLDKEHKELAQGLCEYLCQKLGLGSQSVAFKCVFFRESQAIAAWAAHDLLPEKMLPDLMPLFPKFTHPNIVSGRDLSGLKITVGLLHIVINPKTYPEDRSEIMNEALDGLRTKFHRKRKKSGESCPTPSQLLYPCCTHLPSNEKGTPSNEKGTRTKRSKR
jgi:hypothetical protein